MPDVLQTFGFSCASAGVMFVAGEVKGGGASVIAASIRAVWAATWVGGRCDTTGGAGVCSVVEAGLVVPRPFPLPLPGRRVTPPLLPGPRAPRADNRLTGGTDDDGSEAGIAFTLVE